MSAEAAAEVELDAVVEEGDSSCRPAVDDDDEAAAKSASRLVVSDRII